MATPVIAKGGPIPPELNVYRALNPVHMQEGLPGENHFVMRQKHEPGDGVSLGVAVLITLSQMRSLEVLRQLFRDEPFGIAELNVEEALEPVAESGISVIQQDDPTWGAYQAAHAVLTGYQAFAGAAGKKRISELQRHLVKLARKRFYPAGSETATTTE